MQILPKTAHIKIPDQKLREICQRYHVRRLALFGSVVGSGFTRKSDVDILVSFEAPMQVGFLTLARMQKELATLLKREVDLVPLEGLKPIIREQVLSSSQEIYAA